MMRGGKDEEKTMGPLFPRLHVNDADKGGPRAPPRNKMALYEQLSIPSQRFNPGAASALPLPPFNAGNSIPSASFSQGGVHERNVFSPFYMPQSSANSTEVVQTPSSDGNNLNSGGTEFGRRISRYTNHRSSSAARPVAECSSLRPLDSSNAKASGEKFDDDDLRVPMFIHSGSSQLNKNRLVMEETRSTLLRAKGPQGTPYTSLNYSINYPYAYEKTLEQSNTDNRSRLHEKTYIRQVSKDTVVFKEHMEKSVPNLETEEEPAETSNSFKACSNKKIINSNIVIEKAGHRSTSVCQESTGKDQLRCLSATQLSAKEDDLRGGSKSCSKGLFSNSNGGPNVAGNYNGGNDDKTSGSIKLKDTDRNGDVSETSMVDSMSDLEISPDDVVGMIGQKQFWKARRAIVNQQRVFAVQVFELHRLIKVQKLIAASPHLLLEDDPYLCGSSHKVPDKNLPPESSSKPQSQIGKQKDDSQKLNQSEECRKDNTRAPTIPSREDVLNEGLHQLPRYGPYSGSLPSQVPMAPENAPTPWSYPPANQWLVPVMSPSEGLIYKPFTGPCPPGAGFMAPVYGSYGPTSLPPVTGDFMNAAYGVPASQQHNMPVLSGAPAIPSNYFSTPFGVPNPNTCASIVEQISPMTVSRPKAQIEQRSRSSCNMEIPRRDVTSAGPSKLRASKGSELQGSTASSPCERALGEAKDALPLFPTAPVVDGSAQPSESYGRDHQARVIKVVPHNARSATESAARIFRSIQEERQQNEL